MNYRVEGSYEALSSLKILSVYDRLFLQKARYIMAQPHLTFLKILLKEMKWIHQFI